MSRSVSLSVTVGDALTHGSDVLVLKYAQNLYGLDGVVFTRLRSKVNDLKLPDIDNFTLVPSLGTLGADSVLFVGVKPLRQFGYSEIREFAKRSLVSLSRETPDVRHIAFTIHGPGYGLDEIEAFESEVAGVVEAITDNTIPQALESITFIEHDKGRTDRLSASLAKLLPGGKLSLDANGLLSHLTDNSQIKLRTVGYASLSKPHIFVAMPFADEMNDIFHYGIQGAANASGLLCERADLSVFTGDVMDWVKKRISSATLVVADLSSANPNVYLEVGYAWGCGVPTVLLAREVNDLKFDVKGQHCIIYKSIQQLEESLLRELKGLTKQSQP